MAPVLHAVDMAKLVKVPATCHIRNMQMYVSLFAQAACGILQDEVLVVSYLHSTW